MPNPQRDRRVITKINVTINDKFNKTQQMSNVEFNVIQIRFDKFIGTIYKRQN